MLLLVVVHFEVLGPGLLVEVKQHFLFEFTLAIVDHDWVIVLVKASLASNNRVFLDVTNVRGSLSRLDFTSRHDHFLFDVTEAVNHNLSFHRLNRVNNNTDLSFTLHLHRSLSLNISSWKPRSKTGMRMVPSNNVVFLSNLLKHVHVLLLEYRVDRFNRDSSSCLRHREDIFTDNSIVIFNLSNHESHNFERNSSLRVLQHLQESQWRDVDLLTCIVLRNLSPWLHARSSTHARLAQQCL